MRTYLCIHKTSFDNLATLHCNTNVCLQGTEAKFTSESTKVRNVLFHARWYIPFSHVRPFCIRSNCFHIYLASFAMEF